MLLINLIIAVFAMSGGVLFVIFYVKNSWINYDKKLKLAVQQDDHEVAKGIAAENGNLLLDILPILIPIILIGLGAFLEFKKGSLISEVFNFVSLPLVAVLIGAFVAGLQVREKGKRNAINKLVEQAILKSALVIMIAGAGGSLGYVIKETGIQNEVVAIFSEFPFLGIMLPFVVASILAISTGSITVSLVGTASMLGPMIDSLPISPEMTVALIGCGSFIVFHANSSFFWLLNRLHEVPPKILYRTYTVQSLVMGLSGLFGVFVLKLFGF